jgi:hypothetical protein
MAASKIAQIPPEATSGAGVAELIGHQRARSKFHRAEHLRRMVPGWFHSEEP